MKKNGSKRIIHPKQKKQVKPGQEHNMVPEPVFDNGFIERGSQLKGKVALISGGDSGIGKATAVAFTKQGCDVAITYLPGEKTDALQTQAYVEEHYGKRCLLLPGDVAKENTCVKMVERVVKHFGRLDILVNNAGTHYPKDSIAEISSRQLVKTFELNVFSMFYMVKAALPYLKAGASIINTASVTAYRGSAHLLDYSATKGAVVSFTRSLAASLVEKKIRVNAVAPGPVWTPLIASSMKPEQIKTFGSDSPMKRPGQPVEIAGCYLFLASEAASFITGQVLHPNGGEIING
ncbi:MAG: SDR family oxidoreductase [Bacteroidota bacterium]